MTPDKWLETVDLRSFRRRLLRWFDRFGRQFDWRNVKDPYAVWVSEVMLQQTTTATVSRRFPQFLKQFPTVQALAAASEDAVTRAWEGLGYYRRARNLHRASRVVVADHNGRVPSDPLELRSLPGLGRYSANAILCFAGNAPLPILEANTIRVWSRLCGVLGDVTKQPYQKQLWEVAGTAIPRMRPRDFNLALMDLGAMICTPANPDCSNCPVSRECVAFQSGRPEQFPANSKKPETIQEKHVVVVLRRKNRYLVNQRPEGGRWAGMWEFPNTLIEPGENQESAGRRLVAKFDSAAAPSRRLPDLKHGVMHFRIHATCFQFDAGSTARPRRLGRAKWTTLAEMADLPFSSAHRRIVTFLTNAPVGESRRAGETT